MDESIEKVGRLRSGGWVAAAAVVVLIVGVVAWGKDAGPKTTPPANARNAVVQPTQPEPTSAQPSQAQTANAQPSQDQAINGQPSQDQATVSSGDPRQGVEPIKIGVEKDAEARLARLRTALPEKIELSDTVKLSTSHMSRAVALFQRFGDKRDGPVIALGEDGKLRELDVVRLGPVTDRDGNRQIALDDTALSPDGRQAAFSQKGEVVIVNLMDATVKRWAVPGLNEMVSWRPDNAGVLVEQEEKVFLVDTVTGKVTRQPYPGFGTVAARDPGTDIFRLRTETKPELTRWDAAGTLLSRSVPALSVGSGEWWGTGWLREGRIARDVFGTGGPRPYADVFEAEATIVLDADSGGVDGALILPGVDRWKGCCPVLGWYDEDTVLLASHGSPSRLLAWRVGTGELFQIADLPAQTVVALGDIRL